jgi:hypothetical protein
VARARAHPDADGSRPDVVHSFRNNCKAVIENSLFDGTFLLIHNAPGRDASTAVERGANKEGRKREGRRRKAEGGRRKAEGRKQRGFIEIKN